MAKKHLFQVHYDFKTGFFYKFFIIFGCILTIIYLVESLFHPLGMNEDGSGAILAFAILCLGFGLILYFFSCQFTKLSQIADDVENDETLNDEEKRKEGI